MLAFMGFKDWPIPEFAAHLIFELYERDGRWEVEFMYNPHPRYYTFESDALAMESSPQHGQDMSVSKPILSRRLSTCTPLDHTTTDGNTLGDFLSGSMKKTIYPIRLPRAESPCEVPPVVSWDAREFGKMAFEEFEQILLDERHCFHSDQEWDYAERAHLEGTQLKAKQKSAGPERVKRFPSSITRERVSSDPPSLLIRSSYLRNSSSGIFHFVPDKDDSSTSSESTEHPGSAVDPGSVVDPDDTVGVDSAVDIDSAVDADSRSVTDDSTVDVDSIVDHDLDSVVAYNDVYECRKSSAFQKRLATWLHCFCFCGDAMPRQNTTKNHGHFLTQNI